MGFNNGYDSGYADAIEDVRSGRVAGLGPAAETPQGGGAAFDAGVLEGYDVEKLLSETDLNTYLSDLTDVELLSLVVDTTLLTPGEGLSGSWNLSIPNNTVKLGSIFSAILTEIQSRGLISGGD